MADTKISALTVATTPLAGTEVLPIVQSGVTKQVSVANLTAGRAISADSLSLTGSPLPATSGGTGQSSYVVGDLLYASTTTALSKLADVATGNALISGGVGVAPSWGKIGLTTHVSGTLGTANGGTGLSSFTANRVLYTSSTSAIGQSGNLTFDGTTLNVIGGGSGNNPMTVTRNSDPTGNGLVVANASTDFSSNLLYVYGSGGTVNQINGSYLRIADVSGNTLLRSYYAGLTVAGGGTSVTSVRSGDAMLVGGGRVAHNSNAYSFNGPYTVATISSGSNGTISTVGGGVTIVTGGIAFNNFWDVVVWQYAGTTAVLGSATYGSPSSRTYSVSSGNLVLAMSNNNNTGSYGISITNLGG